MLPRLSVFKLYANVNTFGHLNKAGHNMTWLQFILKCPVDISNKGPMLGLCEASCRDS